MTTWRTAHKVGETDGSASGVKNNSCPNSVTQHCHLDKFCFSLTITQVSAVHCVFAREESSNQRRQQLEHSQARELIATSIYTMASTDQLQSIAAKSVVVHPLVLLSIQDHAARAAKGTRKRVVGILLGQDLGPRGINVANSFAGESFATMRCSPCVARLTFVYFGSSVRRG